MDRLNCFLGFDRQPAHWENPITRAFLVLLRFVPAVRVLFVEQVRRFQSETGTPAEWLIPPYVLHDGRELGYETQVSAITCATGGRLTSMLLCREAELPPESVRPVDRRAVYDGVFAFGDQVLLIENKPNQKAETRQLNPSIAEGERFEINPHPVVMVWRDLISGLSQLLERGDVSGA